MRFRIWLLCAGLALLPSLASCGGGGGGSSSDALSIGIVSGTTPTVVLVTFTNPHAVPATLSLPGSASPFRVDASAFPATPVPGGADIELPVVFTPVTAGEAVGDAHLSFHDGANAITVIVPMRATVETVDIVRLSPLPSFANLPFGQTADRAVTLANRATQSPVTFTQASFSQSDFELVSPAMPFVLGPGASMVAIIRYRCWRTLGAVAANLTLRSDAAQGTTTIGLTASGTAATAVIDLGRVQLTNGSTGVLEIDVPADVYSLTVEAIDPGADYDNSALYDVMRGLLPPSTASVIDLARLTTPDGRDIGFWSIAPNAPTSRTAGYSMTMPYSDQPAHALTAGGGTYQCEFTLSNPPQLAELDVRFLLKAAPGAALPDTGVVDLNVWIGTEIGITPAQAPNDASLQTALDQTRTILQAVGLRFGVVRYFSWDDSAPGTVADLGRPGVEGVAQSAIPDGGLNLLLYKGGGGLAAAVGGTERDDTLLSWNFAGWDFILGRDIVIAHELLHYLGLFHTLEDPLVDTLPGGTNLMSNPPGRSVTPGQGRVVRRHPLVRHP